MKKGVRILSTIMILSMVVALLPVELSASEEPVVIYEENVESMEADISSEPVVEEMVESDVPEEAVVEEPIEGEIAENETDLAEAVDEEAESDVLPAEETDEEVSEDGEFTTMATTYNASDVAIVQGIIAGNPASFTGVDISDPYTWGGIVAWTTVGAEFRISILYLRNRGLTGTLDVSGLTELVTLYCSGNTLAALNIDGIVNLKTLDCNNNQITSLNLSTNTSLTYIDCTSNLLTALDISNNTLLEHLGCGSNNLTSLNTSNNVMLTSLGCAMNNISILDLKNNTELIDLSCNYNQLTSLDVSKQLKLISLVCYNNKLTSLDVSNNAILTTLACFGNPITSLDLTNNVALTRLLCALTQISSLDLSKNINLTHISWSFVPVRELITPFQKTITVAPTKAVYTTGNYDFSNGNIEFSASKITGRTFEKWEFSTEVTIVEDKGNYIRFVADKDITVRPVYRYDIITEPQEFKGDNTGVSTVVYGENPYYQKVTIDGKDVTVNVTANSDGTLSIDIPAEYLKKLSNGEHTLRVHYTDGYAETTIKVSGNVEETVQKPTTPSNTTKTTATTPTRASSSSARSASASSVRTGDSSNLYLWTVLCIMALIVITGSVSNMSKRKYRRDK